LRRRVYASGPPRAHDAWLFSDERRAAFSSLHSRRPCSSKANHVGEILFSGHDKAPSSKPPFVTNGTGLVKNLNADMVDGKQAADLVDKAELMFAVVDAAGKLEHNRGATTATRSTGAPTPTYVVSFAGHVNKCASTASPTDTAAGTLAVTTGSDGKSVIVTESGTASGFHLQVTC
jgi:hypothetical protein